MSGANAISGITVVGAVAAATTVAPTIANILCALAIVTATINVVGGFLVTDRMLRMFGRKKPKALKAEAASVPAEGREAVSK
jgi:NAD(P) transhydrogenase subunit alpha